MKLRAKSREIQYKMKYFLKLIKNSSFYKIKQSLEFLRENDIKIEFLSLKSIYKRVKLVLV